MKPKSLALAGGVLHGLVIMFMTIIHMVTGLGSTTLALLTDLIPMYTVSIFGSIIGLVYGVVIGFILFYVLGILIELFDD